MGDAEGGGVVVALAELVQQVRAEGGAAAGAGVFDGLVRLAQDGDDVAGPGLQAAGAEFHDRPASPDDVLAALLDAGQPGQQVLVAGVAVGHQQPGERGRDARGDIALAPRGRGPAARSAARPGSGRSARAGHPQPPSPCLPGPVLPFLPRSGLRGVLVQHVHRGLVRGQRVLAGQRREHRLVEPGLAQLRRQPGSWPCPPSPARPARPAAWP